MRYVALAIVAAAALILRAPAAHAVPIPFGGVLSGANEVPAIVPWPHRRSGSARPDLGVRGPSYMVATPSEDSLKARSNDRERIGFSGS
jgi:hypothetical protein